MLLRQSWVSKDWVMRVAIVEELYRALVWTTTWLCKAKRRLNVYDVVF